MAIRVEHLPDFGAVADYALAGSRAQARRQNLVDSLRRKLAYDEMALRQQAQREGMAFQAQENAQRQQLAAWSQLQDQAWKSGEAEAERAWRDQQLAAQQEWQQAQLEWGRGVDLEKAQVEAFAGMRADAATKLSSGWRYSDPLVAKQQADLRNQATRIAADASLGPSERAAALADIQGRLLSPDVSPEPPEPVSRTIMVDDGTGNKVPRTYIQDPRSGWRPAEPPATASESARGPGPARGGGVKWALPTEPVAAALRGFEPKPDERVNWEAAGGYSQFHDQLAQLVQHYADYGYPVNEATLEGVIRSRRQATRIPPSTSTDMATTEYAMPSILEVEQGLRASLGLGYAPGFSAEPGVEQVPPAFRRPATQPAEDEAPDPGEGGVIVPQVNGRAVYEPTPGSGRWHYLDSGEPALIAPGDRPIPAAASPASPSGSSFERALESILNSPGGLIR